MSQAPPYPKKKLLSKREPNIFPRFIANFSIEFVNWCLDNYSHPETMILDNFAGSSTSLISCMHYGLNSYGIEINPAWVIYGKARSVNYSKNLYNLVKDEMNKIEICTDLHTYYNELINQSLNNYENDDSEYLFIISAALLIAYREIINPIYRTNHSWPLVEKDNDQIPSFNHVQSKINEIIEHTIWMSKYYPKNAESSLIWGDSTHKEYYKHQYDLIITSPPYLSRLDYIVSTRPEIMLFNILDLDIKEHDLRLKQIGTPVKENFDEEEYNDLPDSCINLFKKIENHESKGSKVYYLPTIKNYFYKMDIVLSILNDRGSNEAKIIMVMRDSWYKDIYMSTSSLISDIFLKYDWSLHNNWKYKIKSMMLLTNPYTKKWRNNSDLYESINIYQRK